jgi:hypothetical protein
MISKASDDRAIENARFFLGSYVKEPVDDPVIPP